MDRDQFKAALHTIRISEDEFAALIGRSLRTVREFGGRAPVPYYARAMLFLLEERGGADDLFGPRAQPRDHLAHIQSRMKMQLIA